MSICKRWLPSRTLADCLVVAAICVACSAPLGLQSAEAEPDDDARKYSAGPLAAADFGATPPEPLPERNGVRMLAFTSTTIRWAYRYSCKPKGRIYVALATEVSLECVFDQDESWLARPEDAGLLRHEQGHFDIAECTTRIAQRAFDQLIEKRELRKTARTEAAAIALLKRAILEEYERYRAEGLEEQARYDVETQFGTDATVQHQWDMMLAERLSSTRPVEAPEE